MSFREMVLYRLAVEERDQKWLSDKLDVSQETLSAKLHNPWKLTVEQLSTIGHALNFDALTFMVSAYKSMYATTSLVKKAS